MTMPELREEVVQWLRSFSGQLEAGSAEELRELIYANFVADTALFPARDAIIDVLRELHQEPTQDWSRKVQMWRPRPLRLEFYHDAPALR